MPTCRRSPPAEGRRLPLCSRSSPAEGQWLPLCSRSSPAEGQRLPLAPRRGPLLTVVASRRAAAAPLLAVVASRRAAAAPLLAVVASRRAAAAPLLAVVASRGAAAAPRLAIVASRGAAAAPVRYVAYRRRFHSPGAPGYSAVRQVFTPTGREDTLKGRSLVRTFGALGIFALVAATGSAEAQQHLTLRAFCPNPVSLSGPSSAALPDVFSLDVRGCDHRARRDRGARRSPRSLPLRDPGYQSV